MSRLVITSILVGMLCLVAASGCYPVAKKETATVQPTSAAVQSTEKNNPPWYPSLAAFEHYDSGRSHLFPRATFGGAFSGNNTVSTVQTHSGYPSPWNIVYLDADNAFLYGGSSGDDASSIGAYVAKINPQTLEPVWFRQLIDATQAGEWNYPGTLALLDDGYLYVIYGYHLSKVDPSNGDVIATLVLPTGGAAPGDTTYNGFSAASDGTIVAKSFYRQAGCTVQGPNALARCSDPSDVPNSVVVTIDPKAMKIIQETTLPAMVIGRATVGQYDSQESVLHERDICF